MTTSPIRIELLGGLCAYRDEDAIRSFETRKAAELLSYLALAPGRSFSRDYLAELLWPDEDPVATSARLRQALSSIRRVLGESILTGERGTVCLDKSLVVTDLQEMEKHRRDGARLDGSVREQRLREGIALYKGDLLPELDAAWVTPERERWADAYHEMLAELASDLADRGEHQAAIEFARQGVRNDPLREPARVLLIRCLARAGRSSEALRQYQDLERVLQSELGADASPETRRLVEQIRAGEFSEVSTQPAGKPPPALPAFESAPGTDSSTSPAAGTAPAEAGARPQATRAPLPVPVSRFFGREEEIEFIRSSLAPAGGGGSRLLTITGIGGAGKTSLAAEAARRLEGEFRGRVWFVPLADVPDADRMQEAVHVMIGLERAAGSDSRSEIVRVLGQESSLLVLDNLEHLANDGAKLVGEWLSLVPNLSCLVTSRRRLDVRGERELSLPPLPTPPEDSAPDEMLQSPAVQLFLDRVQAIRPRFSVTKENAATVGEVCRCLDGLPLAIDLVAGWAAALTPAQMRDRLMGGTSAGIDLLVSRSAQANPRHRSLRETLEASVEQLPLPLRSFFFRLSVFRGGFSLEAAEQVAGSADVDALSAIAELQGRSLVREDESPTQAALSDGIRFRILQPVRAFAADRLSQDHQSAEVQERHAKYFFALAADSRGVVRSNEADCLNRLEAEHDNLRAALHWGGEHDPPAAIVAIDSICRFLHLRGHSREWRPWLDSLLEKTRETLSDRVFAAGLHAQASLAHAQSDFRAARLSFEKAIEVLRRTGDREELIEALRNIGIVVRLIRDYEAARRYFEEALALMDDSGDPRPRLLLMLDLGYAHFGVGETEEAKKIIRQSLAGYRALSDRFGIASANSMLATVLWPEKQYAECRALLSESVAIAREDGQIWLLASGLHGLGDLARYEGDLAAARSHYRESVEYFRRRDSVVGLLYVVESSAALAAAERDMERAACLAGAAVARRAETGSPLPPEEKQDLDAVIGTAREALGPEPFEAAFAAGALLTVDQAVDLALAR